MLGQQGLRFIVRGGRVETLGLATIEHCDLRMQAATEAEVEKAKALLFRLVAYVVSSATRLRPGDTVVVDDQEVTLAAAGDRVLEVTLVADVETVRNER
jgi:transcription elongation GreA/GreB family factor